MQIIEHDLTFISKEKTIYTSIYLCMYPYV